MEMQKWNMKLGHIVNLTACNSIETITIQIPHLN